jgi:hypothetical protein
MTIKELMEELKEHDETLEVVTCDGYGSVDAILKVSIERINDRDDIVSSDSFFADEDETVVVIGWNQ